MAKLKEITLEELNKNFEVVSLTKNYARKGKDISVKNKETNKIERFFISDLELRR